MTATATGTPSSLPVIPGQSVSVGDAVGQVAPPSFSVAGTLTPAELYRLLNQPTEATVTVTGGPAPFTCTGLTMAATLAGANQDSSAPGASSGASAPSGTDVRCAVPSTIRVVNGLQATLAIPGGSVKNVLVAPVTAVEGIADVGDVSLVSSSGKAVKTTVELGLNDGHQVQILCGLMESVVATVAARALGVISAVLLIENPISRAYIARGVVDVPPFPFSVAVIGIVSSTVVGALAGLLPALVAVRVKVIDAICFSRAPQSRLDHDDRN